MAKGSASKSMDASSAPQTSKRIVESVLRKFKSGKTRQQSSALKAKQTRSAKAPLYKTSNDSQETLADVNEHQQSKLRKILKKLKRRPKKHATSSSKTVSMDVDCADDDADERTLCDIDIEPALVGMGKLKADEPEAGGASLSSWQDFTIGLPPLSSDTSSTSSPTRSMPPTPRDSRRPWSSTKSASCDVKDANAMDVESHSSSTIWEESIDYMVTEDPVSIDMEIDNLSTLLAQFEVTEGRGRMWTMWLYSTEPGSQVPYSPEVQMTLEAPVSSSLDDMDLCGGASTHSCTSDELTVSNAVISQPEPFQDNDESSMDCSADPFAVHKCENLLCACCYLPPIVRSPDIDWDMEDSLKKRKRKHRIPRTTPEETFCGVTIDVILRPKKAPLSATRRRIFGPYELSHRRHPVTKY
ncbi:hypothetical protein NM688_g7275 [Phlebia brevispora]|uniref:Uncharacterized protein n=1 Tax=Phlebia brevispora TaxID=194682 RepID=A0ACC1S7B1_9APHY|nr:hypothetical protein NM688_g7275 [Phlebia brevispora]